jgi:WD40 repeat protein
LSILEGFVASVAFSPDGNTLAAGFGFGEPSRSSGGGGVVLWDVAARRRLADGPLPVKEGLVLDVAFSPDGETIAAGFGHPSRISGGGVVLWDVAARRRLTDGPLPVGEGFVTSVAFSPDGKTLAAGFGDPARSPGGGGVVLWDVAARKRLADGPLPVKEGSVLGIAFSPDGETIATGFGESSGGVVLWDVAARKRLADGPLPVKEGRVRDVAFSPDGKTLAAGFDIAVGGRASGGVVLWDVAARKRLGDGPLPVKEGRVRGVAFSPDGKTLATGVSLDGPGGGVVLWDVAARKRVADGPLPVKEGLLRGIAFSPDSRTLAAGFHDSARGIGGVVVLWDVAARKWLADGQPPVTEWPVLDVAFSPDGKTLAAGFGFRSGGVVLWDVAARKWLADGLLPVKERPVRGVAFSPDGKTLAAGFGSDIATGPAGGGVVLWDVAARKRVADGPLPVKEGRVWDVAFSPDGGTLAAGFGSSLGSPASGGVVLWDVAARERLMDGPLPVKEGNVPGVAFSPDGKTLATGVPLDGPGGGVVLWDVDLKSWQRLAGQIANRNFTREEWRQYFPDEPYRATFPDLPIPPQVASHDEARSR